MKKSTAAKTKATRSTKTATNEQPIPETVAVAEEPTEQPGAVEVPTVSADSATGADQLTPVWVALDLIDFSPLNYRKYYNPDALQEFAEGLKTQGIISPVTLRIVTEGRYELVVGERRIRGGRLAGLTGSPAVIRVMTDEQVEEAQLAENVGREDTHPMHDAEAIDRMYKRGLTTDEIAARLGKSRNFVYQRRRLCALTPDFQEMFLAGIILHTEALEIATLRTDAQESMFTAYCADWKVKDRSQIDYHRIANGYNCSLRIALFDLNDSSLYPEAGACAVCPHNSGYTGLLFTDDNTEARCGKRPCFDMKTRLHFIREIVAATEEHHPAALIFGQQVSEMVRQALAELPATKELPTHVANDVTLWEEPESPNREDFLLEDECYGEEEEEGEDEGVDEEDDETDEREPAQEPESTDEESGPIDEEAYAAALAEYQEDLAVYRAAIEDNKVSKAFHFSSGRMELVYFSPESRKKAEQDGKRLKVADMIKAGTDTPDILEAEIESIRKRETRYQELDREKVQKHIHEKFTAALPETPEGLEFKDSDRIASRWIAFHGLPHDYRDQVEASLGIEIDGRKTKREKLYEVFATMTPQQEAFLYRAALLAISDSKSPTTFSGHFLYKTAEGAGVDTQAIEKQQANKAENRRDNQEVKITLYKKRIKRHRRKAA